MQKIGAGYSAYFNNRHKRSGYLFQGRFKASRIDDDNYLKTALTYIHTNPISIVEPKWKKAGVNNPETVNDFLEEY